MALLPHRTREVAMRLVACLTVCVIPVVANAAQTESQPPSDPQAYCVDRGADFYPYTGEPCKRWGNRPASLRIAENQRAALQADGESRSVNTASSIRRSS